MNNIAVYIFKLLFLIVFSLPFHANIYCQIGCSISYSSDRVLGGNLFYIKNGNGFYLGFSNQFNGQKKQLYGKEKIHMV